MAIVETIEVNVAGLGELDAAAAAADKAAEAFARLQEAASKGLNVSAGGAGADKLAASMDAAAAKIDDSVAKIQASFDKLAAMGDTAASGLESVGAAADSAAAPLDAVAAAADEAAAAQDRLAESADASGAALDKSAVAGERSAVAGDAAAAGAAAGAESHSKLGEYALGAAVVIGYATDQAMKFNGQMTLLQTQAGVSAKQMPELTRGVLELAGATGQSPGNLAESLYHVASNMESMPGTTTVQMLNAVKIAAEGASTGHSNLVDTTTALTSVIASGIPGAKNYSQAMGAINATVGVGEMNMQQLAEAMGTGVVPVVKGYGLTLKDVGAALATYGDLNIRGAKAGTELRMAVQALAVPAAAATTELGHLGLTTTSLSKDMESGGLNKALLDLNQRFKDNGITAKNEGAVITELFGKKAGAGLALLLENMDRVESKYPALTKGANDFGHAWDTTLQTPQEKLKQLESGAQAMAITLGNIAMPAASAVMGGLDKAMSFVQDHAFASKGLTLGLGTLIAGGLTKGIFSGVESGLSGIGKLGSLLQIPGMDKLANIGQGAGASGAASGLSGAATALDGAASSLEGAAATLKEGGAAGGLPGAARGAEGEAAGVEGEAAGAAEGAGGAGIFTKIFGSGSAAGTLSAMAGPIMQGLLGGLIVKGLGDQLAPKGTAAGSYNAMLQHQAAQGPGPASQLHSNVFGGFEGYLTQHIGEQVGGAINHALGSTGSYFASVGSGLAHGAEHDVSDVGHFFGGLFGGGGSSAAPVVKPKVEPPDASALAGFTSTLSQAMHLTPVKMPAPDTSAIKEAAGQVQSDLTALEAVHPKPIKIPSPDLSALDAAKGKAQAAGAAAGAGFAAGVASETGAAAAAGASLAAAAEAAMKVHLQISSPSKVTEKIGIDTAAGYTKGIKDSTSAVKAASASIGSDSVASLIQGLEGGQSNQQNVATALAGALANPDAVTTIQQTIQELTQDIPAGKDTGLVKWLNAQQSKLSGLANQQGALMAQITDAQQVATSQISNASITGAYGYQPALSSGGPIAAQSLVQGMGLQAADQTQYAQVLAQLKGQGLNATTLSQFAQEGASAGLPTALGLEQGGKGAVGQINALEKQIIGASQQIGNTGGTAMYQAGLAVTNGLDTALKASLKQVGKEMAAEATEITTEVEKKLGTKASSSSSSSSSGTAASAASTAGASATAAGGLGKISAAGAAAASGLDKAGSAGGTAASGLDKVASAAGSAASALNRIASHGSGSGGGGGGGGGGGNVTVNVTVQGSVMAENDLMTTVQNGLLRMGSQNWQTGIIFPGRHN